MEINETELSMEDNQIEEQSLNNSDHIKDEAGNEEHCNKMLAKCEEEIELLEKLLGECGNRKEIFTEVPDSRRESLIVMETEEYFNLQTKSLFAGTVNSINEYDDVVKDIEQKLFGDEIKVQKQQEGKDVRVVVRIQQLQSEGNQQLPAG